MDGLKIILFYFINFRALAAISFFWQVKKPCPARRKKALSEGKP